ncbi:hypothetical protein NMG60_11027321 [Bertholletia excelsa]
MDYEDNDFPGQNLYLAGEGSSKFSPVLRPYALPKFDFDDGLQSHLRFDSLVENEVFLGIPSQEDNHWIEDFSRGSNGIEFNTSAAESCSISRRNNVWSEATSVESVEMLLKSVGQEQKVPGETIIEESDACDELANLTDQMEPHVKQDFVKDICNSETALASDKLLEHSSRLNDAEGTLNTQETEASTCESSHGLGPIASSATCDVFVTKCNARVDGKWDNRNQFQVITSVNESLENRMPKDFSSAEMQIDDIGSYAQDIAALVVVSKNQESENLVSDASFENVNCHVTDTDKPVGECYVLDKDVDPNDQNLEGLEFEYGSKMLKNRPSKVKPIEQHKTAKCNFEKPATLLINGDENLQRADRCSGHLCPSESHKSSKSQIINKRTEIHEPFNGDVHEDAHIVFQSDSNLEGHAIEVGNMKVGISASSEQTIDHANHPTHDENNLVKGKDHLQGIDHQLDSEPSVGIAEASLVSGICNEVSSENSGLTVSCSAVEVIVEEHVVENLVVDDASAVQEEINTKGDTLFPMVAGTVQKHGSSDPYDVHDHRLTSFKEKEKSRQPNGSSNTECQVSKRVRDEASVKPSSQEGDVKVNNELVDGSECVLSVTLKNANLTSDDTMDAILLLSGTGASENQVLDNSDKNKKMEEEALAEPKSERGLDSVLELEKDASHNSDPEPELPHGALDQLLPVEETCNSTRASEQSGQLLPKICGQSVRVAESSSILSQSEQAVKANEISESSSSKLEVCLKFHESAEKPDACAKELAVPGNHDETAMRKNLEVASSEVADSVKLNCSPNCTVLSQSEMDKNGIKELMANDMPLSQIGVPSTPQNVSRNYAAKDVKSFTFKATGISEQGTSEGGLSFPTVQASTVSMIVERSPATPCVRQMDSIDTKLTPELSCGSSQASFKETVREVLKATQATLGEMAPFNQSESGDKSCGLSTSLSGTSQFVQFEGLKPYGNTECSATVPCGVVSVSTSSLPDLNTSAPSSALFQQPFTDLQQVQLRAQIFVYGSLIQGIAPDEAYMVSAFGTSDGVRNIWEPVWRACVQRLQGRKSHPSKSESPVQPHSGVRPSDQTTKHVELQNKVLPLPVGQASSKVSSSPAVNSMIPLSSSLSNIPTPDSLLSSGIPRSDLLDYHQTLHTFQTPPVWNSAGHTTSWLSPSPLPGSWVAPRQTSAADASTHFSLFPITETVKLTPVKESSTSVASGKKHASPSTVIFSTGPGGFLGNSSLSDLKKAAVSSGKNSSDPKARKRKKVVVSENLFPISLVAQTRTESVSAPVISSHLSTSVVVSTPSYFESKANTDKNILAVSAPFFTNHPKRGEQNAEQKATLSEDTLSKIEEAKQQAENASALAAAAANHSQTVWSQLDKHKNSGWTPDAETKLASAAVAVKAAASVAKAAAAAAMIASNAALQVKLMADEAFMSPGTGNPSQKIAACFSDVLNNFGKATSASILKARDGSSASSSVIVAAREVARSRVEASSAASKYAENLDAIIKAAELAADAVSETGKIVAMDAPFPLNELVKAGPEGYWRVPHLLSEQDIMLNDGNREQPKVHSIEGPSIAGRAAKEGPKKAKTINRGLPPLSKEVSRNLLEVNTRAVDGVSSSLTISESDSQGQRSCRASDVSKTIGVISKSEIGSGSVFASDQDDYGKGVGTLKENSIKEGCLVEVCKVGDGLKVAWFSAAVLSLNEGKAFVCYQELQSEDGLGQRKEWVELEAEGNNAPQIRLPHPIHLEGTRKRRRAAMGDYTWTVGDRVDVRMQDCWREGVVTEKSRKDDTTLTVYFPAEGETSVVKAWHLRPTLIWKDGEWIECFGSKRGNPSSQGDTPPEKHLKFGNLQVEGRESDSTSKSIELMESGRLKDSQLLSLPANEKIFNIGKNSRDVNKPRASKTVWTGLQKEGSRVIFGVPKPGKKRKFMEVSKHYVAEKTSKINELNDSVKFANYLMPLESGSCGWNTKIDAKEKQPDESRIKVPQSGKTHTVSGRTLQQKDNLLTSVPSAPNEDMGIDHVSVDENDTGQQMGFGSFSNIGGAAEGPALFSSQALSSEAPSKIVSSSNAKTECFTIGKQASSTGKSAKGGVDSIDNSDPEKLISEFVERRRSNRRIQPTSRLLEGLQSSLIISKIPAVSHEKSHRSQSRSASKEPSHFVGVNSFGFAFCFLF